MLEAHGCAPRLQAEGATNLGLLRLAESGLGIAVLPAALAARAVERGRLRRVQVTGGVFSRRYFLAFLTRKYRAPALEQALAAVRAFFSGAENG